MMRRVVIRDIEGEVAFNIPASERTLSYFEWYGCQLTGLSPEAAFERLMKAVMELNNALCPTGSVGCDLPEQACPSCREKADADESWFDAVSRGLGAPVVDNE